MGSEPRLLRALRDVFGDEKQKTAHVARLAVQLCRTSVIAAAPRSALACGGIAG
jgi:hypothetical protein